MVQVRGLEWDPFYHESLATAGSDGLVKIWRIPEDGLNEDLTTPIVSLNTCEQGSNVDGWTKGITLKG